MNDSNTFKIPEEKKEELKEVEDKAYYENGNLKYKGLLCNGKRIKEWKYYYENVILILLGSYDKYGEQTGVWKTYYENGKVKESIPIKNGKREGVGKEYDETGKVIKETLYRNDKEMKKAKKVK